MLVRAAASLRLIEQALEEQGLPDLRRRRPRLLVPGAGPRRPRLPARCSPTRSTRRRCTPCSPRRSPGCGRRRRSSALARAGREAGGAWAALRARRGRPAPADATRLQRRSLEAERARAERLPAEVLLERAIAATGYDVAVLGRPGGERRLANLRKLMRLAREYERAEGRDLRAFLAFALTQDLSGARASRASRCQSRALQGPQAILQDCRKRHCACKSRPNACSHRHHETPIRVRKKPRWRLALPRPPHPSWRRGEVSHATRAKPLCPVPTSRRRPSLPP